MKKTTCLFVLFFCFFLGFSQHDENTQKDDVRVGLVLSGGGAKGLAHIGVLKVIEESGVRVDYIAGTSMGAIVGALYASGYSADELAQIFQEVDFDELIGDDFERKTKSVFERKDADKRALTLPFNKFKLSFPSGLSKGQNIYNYYVEKLDHVKDVGDFSQLPIPFLCVATNAETGKQVVIEDGYLPNAIAASGAIPSLFEPVLLEGKLLLDGGISNNYPIQELLQKNVDYVIGVDVQDSLRSKEELRSISEVMLQVSNFNTQNQMTEKIEKTDIYIKPDISDYTIVSFESSEDIFQKGLVAADSLRNELVELSKKQKIGPKIVVRNKVTNEFQLNSIKISGNENYTKSYINGKLKLKLDNKVTRDKIDRGIKALAATNNFHVVKYKITHDNNLIVDVDETKNNTYLKLGIHYDNLFKSAALINVTSKQLLTNNDIVSLDLIAGDNFRYELEYYIDKGFYWSVGLRSKFSMFERDVNGKIFLNLEALPVTEDNVSLEALSLSNQFYLETLFKKQFNWAFGVEHNRIKLKNEDLDVDFEDDNLFSVYSQLQYDTLDDKYYPTKGAYFNGKFNLYLISDKYQDDFEQFSVAQARMGLAFTPFSSFYINAFTEGGFRIGNNTDSTLDFMLGGYGNDFALNHKAFYGYDYLNLVGDSYVKADFDFHYEFYKNHIFTASASFANVDDGLFKDSDWLSLPDYSGYALGYGIKTFLGPMQVKGSWSPEIKRTQWFVSLGYWF